MSTDTLFDPLRHKNVAATPEEQVRQWFIGVLSDAGVPSHLMMSEAPMQFASKRWRADILVYGRNGQPLAVVECKRPGVSLDEAVAFQALRYNMVLEVRWMFLTNGASTMVFCRQDGGFKPFPEIPTFDRMLCQH